MASKRVRESKSPSGRSERKAQIDRESKLIDLLDSIISDVRVDQNPEVHAFVSELQRVIPVLPIATLRQIRDTLLDVVGRGMGIATPVSMQRAAEKLVTDVVGGTVENVRHLASLLVQPYGLALLDKTFLKPDQTIEKRILQIEMGRMIERVNLAVETKRCHGSESRTIPWLKYLMNKFNYVSSSCLPTVRITIDGKRGIDPVKEESFVKALDVCLSDGAARYVLFDIVHGWKDVGWHSNLVFLDKRRGTYERFEPHGSFREWDDRFVDEYLEVTLPTKLPALAKFRYVQPFEICPMLGPQAVQAPDPSCPIGGFCLVFSLIYAHLRLAAPDVDQRLIVNSLIDLGSSNLLSLVKRYTSWIDIVT